MKQTTELIAAIKNGHLYRGGMQFTVEEMHRSISCLKPLTTTRVRQLLNQMAAESELDKVAIGVGHVAIEYRAHGSLRSVLRRAWRKPSIHGEHSPVWR